MKRRGKSKTSDNTVFIKSCDEYDRDRMISIVQEGMRRLKYTPSGNIYVKPNVVVAYDPKIFGFHAVTRTSLVNASLLALSKQPGVTRIDMGENCAVGVPTRLCYRYAGYDDMMREVKREAPCPVDMFCIDEEPRDTVFIGGVVHDTLRISRRMARADSVMYLPKLKGHCVSNMTGAVKLNIGICSDDERSIRHDFMLNEKIVDLLSAGYPDFIVMDAIEVGIGNEAFPTVRKLGLIIMGTNPLAVDLVGARLLGYGLDDIPYLKRAVERGYAPKSLKDVAITGDLKGVSDLDKWAKRLLPYDDEYYRWQDVNKELARLESPMRFMWGPYNQETGEKCLTGCVMGIKMFLAAMELFNEPGAFNRAKPVVLVIGRQKERIDAGGQEVFLIGSCAKADVVNAKKITHINKCFTTAVDMILTMGHKLGLKAPIRDVSFLSSMLRGASMASLNKLAKGRYLQDIGHFISNDLLKRI